MLPKPFFLSLLSICTFLASVSILHAEDQPVSAKEDPYFMEKDDFMTTKELYEDCKQAIEYADNGEIREFTRTYCIAQITGYFTAFDRAGFAVAAVYEPPPTIPNGPSPKITYDTKQRVLQYKEVMTALNRTFCIPKEWHKKNIYLLIAKEYVKYMDEHKDSLIQKGSWEKPQALGLSLSIFAPEECKK